MKNIILIANESGSRPALQSWTSPTLPDGYAWCPDEFAQVFYSTSPAGFVNITVENNTVTEMTINQEALDKYIAENPEQPAENQKTVDERVTDLEAQLAESDEAAIALYEAQMAQGAIDAEQDEAILELYELIGGKQ